MLKLHKLDKLLVISGDNKLLSLPTINSFLKNNDFEYDETNSVYRYSNQISPDFVEKIVEFFNEYDEPIELDEESHKLYQKKVVRNQNFEQLQNIGTEIKNQNVTELKIPFMNANSKLKDYQISPVLHAVALGNVANFSVPGSGKTWMAYSAYFLLKNKPPSDPDHVEKLLVIGPISSFKPWETEYQNVTGKVPNSIRISGNIQQRQKIFDDSSKYEIFLVSYATAFRETDALINLLQQNKFLVIVDESHHIKNPNSVSSIAIREISHFAHKRMILTGTMAPNSLEDLWAQFTFLYPNGELVGSFDRFRFNLTAPNALVNLTNQLRPFYTRISKRTLNLPEPKIVRIPVPMSTIQRRIYDTIGGHIIETEPDYRDDLIALREWRRSSLVYLIEASTDPSLLTKNSQYNEELISNEGLPIQELISQYAKFEVPKKLEMVQTLAKESLARKEKIIIWCSFVATIEKLSKMLEKYQPIVVYGALPRDELDDPEDNRELRIEEFKANPEKNVLIANPASLAESVSLHKVCHHAIYVDRTFNGGHYMQSLERIHRIGIAPNIQTRYTIYLSENSIDYDIDARLEIKKNRMLAFLNEDDFGTVNLDLDYNEPIGPDEELEEDYRLVLEHLRKK